MNIIPVVLVLIFGCGSNRGETREPDPTPVEKLRAMYVSELMNYGGGWPSETDCDGSLYAGKAAAGGAMVDLRRAYDDKYQPFRRPTHDCYAEFKEKGEGFGSKSTVSNDMLLGLLHGLWFNRDRETVESFMTYARSVDYIVGQAELNVFTRVVMTPNLMVLYHTALYILSNREHNSQWVGREVSLFKTDKDWVANLQAMQILLWWDMHQAESIPTRTVGDNWDELTADMRQKWPESALFAAVDGIYTGSFDEALRLLLAGSCPTYVRGKDRERLCHAEWLFVARKVLDWLQADLSMVKYNHGDEH